MTDCFHAHTDGPNEDGHYVCRDCGCHITDGGTVAVLTGEPVFPHGFEWSHAAIDDDGPVLVVHEAGSVACKRVIFEFSNLVVAGGWAMTHECEGN